MTDYTKLVEALRERAVRENEWYEHGGDIIKAAAAAIEALQADNAELESCVRTLTEQRDYWKDKAANMEPKRGKWILCGEVGWPNWKCSVCHSEGRGDYRRCPWCGAKMEVHG